LWQNFKLHSRITTLRNCTPNDGIFCYFLADHPFLFVIRNLNFSLGLLIRRVVDPNTEKVIIVIFNLVAKFLTSICSRI
jgi:hypothetical protein